MWSRDVLLLMCCLALLGGLRLTSTTTTTTFVAAMSLGNHDLERYFRSANATHSLASMTEERIAIDFYNYAYLNYSYYEDNNWKEVYFSEEKARYGEGQIFNVSGKLVHISDVQDPTDDTACSSNILGTRGEPTPLAGITWIALVRRGRCTFEEKVKNVYAKGATGVIVYNDRPVMNLEKMQIKGKNRDITAVITYQEIGVDMAHIVDQGIDMMAHIIQGRNGMRPINSLNRTSVLFVSISFIVLMVISLVWLIFYYVQRFRYLQTKDQQSRHLCTVTKKAITKIPTKTCKSSDERDGDNDCCAICIEAYKPSDCIRILPCKHEFHKNCIDPWLIEHRTCPMCKLDVLKFYGYVVGDQIHSTPSPQRVAAAPPPVPAQPTQSAQAVVAQPTIVVADSDAIPIIVVAVSSTTPSMLSGSGAADTQQPQQQPQQQSSSPPSYAQQQQHVSQSQNQPPSNSSSFCNCSVSSGSIGRCRNIHSDSNRSNISVSLADSCCNCNCNCSCRDEGDNNDRNVSCSYNSSQQQLDDTGDDCCCSHNHSSAPATRHVSTASHQFLGSEESILEYDPEPPNRNVNALIPSTTANIIPAAGEASSGGGAASALGDLMRSRDFVIDFPRVFVINAGSTVGTCESIFANRLPERSQSTLSVAGAKGWMTGLTNKLEEQQGGALRRLRTLSGPKDEMQEHLLTVRTDESLRKRRSRSADGRYSTRQEKKVTVGGEQMPHTHEQPEELYLSSRSSMRRFSDISLRELRGDPRPPNPQIQNRSEPLCSIPNPNTNITIQINDDHIDLD